MIKTTEGCKFLDALRLAKVCRYGIGKSESISKREQMKSEKRLQQTKSKLEKLCTRQSSSLSLFVDRSVFHEYTDVSNS